MRRSSKVTGLILFIITVGFDLDGKLSSGVMSGWVELLKAELVDDPDTDLSSPLAAAAAWFLQQLVH